MPTLDKIVCQLAIKRVWQIGDIGVRLSGGQRQITGNANKTTTSCHGLSAKFLGRKGRIRQKIR
jgi:hypothetical protein